MIVYFNKKSKIIKKWGILTCLLMIGIYGLFVWSKIIKNDIVTMQIIHSKPVPIQQTKDTLLESVKSTAMTNSHGEYLFVASSRGKYYYPKTCSRAKSLSVKNVLYFKDKMSAEAAGYVAHSSC